METISLKLTGDAHRKLWNHLLPMIQWNEEAAFGFVRPVEITGQAQTFELVHFHLVGSDGFEYQSGYHLELADHERAKMIKTAHDLNASIVEFHSHLSPEQPAFSPSDLFGFDETVPNVMWRLKGKPYFAVVVSSGGFDGFAWVENPNSPAQVGSIWVDRKELYANGKTLRNYEQIRRKSF